MHDPAITVLMPVYNAALYLREAIDSVLGQSFGDFELLIVNDGSTDSSTAIIDTYTDERIRVHHQENKGVIGALNTGLQLARGTWIARFDGDDICYPQRLQCQYQYVAAHPECILLGSASDYIDKDGHFLFEWQPEAYEHDEIKMAALHRCPLDHPTVFYRRDKALQIGGYPAGALHFEDHLFWMQFFGLGQVHNLREPLIMHRFNPGSVTIDEKWRGAGFLKIKYDAIRKGYITAEEAVQLSAALRGQDLKAFKEAAYYSMIGKKYLWNQYQPQKARQHLRKAIAIMPRKSEPYILYLLSYLPNSIVSRIYRVIKRK